jgi:GNAT superfamily N-acetyltransferase
MNSSEFTSVVIDHWSRGDSSRLEVGGEGAGDADSVRVIVDASLAENRSVSLLRVDGGPILLAVTPERAEELSLVESGVVDSEGLAARIAAAKITLNDPDHIFYLTVAEQAVLRAEPIHSASRQLAATDEDAFAQFVEDAPASDLDDAFVELDHWLVYGTFVDGRLAAAASMYPWGDTRIADLGVITLPEFRGRGLGRATVRAISAAALQRGYEPQYRCQLDNASSVALAASAGFTRFGEWEVIVTRQPD